MTYPTAVGTPDPYNLIEAAFTNGEIDVDHASVYRIFALFASPGLPKRYSSPQLIQADGMGAFMFAMKDFDRLSPATQRFLGMFVIPREITIVPTAIHPSATPTAPFFPHGRYSTVVKTVAHAGGPPVVGRWEMDLQSPDEAPFWLGGKLVITRLYRPRGNHIEFSDEFGSYACDDQERWASYSWSFKEGALVFSHDQENCDLRSAVLEAHPWARE